MKYIIQLMILTRYLLIQGGLEWKVLKKITDYGQNVTLFCNVSNCCPKLAGWDKYTPAQQTIFIDVKSWKPTKKYDGKVLTDGYTLVIQNLTEKDLNVSYACVYGSTIGDKQSLLEENVFNYISTTQHNGPIHNRTFSVENMGTTQQTGPIENRNFSAGKIAGIVCGVFVAVVVVSFVIFVWKRRREMHRNIGNRNAGSNEDVPLIDYFLEDPSNIDCIEGEDATFSCKIQPNSALVEWLKDGNKIESSDNCIVSKDDSQHELKLLNTKLKDNGEYCVQVGEFSRKMQLNIIRIPRELSADERHTYMHAIKSGTEVRQYVRIQVVGKDCVGKTSLVRRLLFLEKGEYGGKSTDGIDISRKCQIRNSDGDWIVGEVDTERKIIERIHRALNKQRRTEEPVSDMPPPLPPKENNSLQNSKNMPKNQSKETSFETKTLETNEGVQTLNNEVQYTKSTYDPVAALYANSDENKLYMRDTKEKPENNDFNLRKETSVSIAVPAENPNDVISEKDDLTAKMTDEKMDDIIWEAKTEKEKNTSEALIECGIWDFAGQRDYYASHQTFFTPHAIYLLVADISEDIKDINYDGNVDYNSIGNYIEFWFDSIHCLCKDLSEDELCPPIIMVCTGTDKVEKDKDWKRMYNEKVSTIISKQKRADHRRGIYFISNTHFLEEDIEEIKRLHYWTKKQLSIPVTVVVRLS